MHKPSTSHKYQIYIRAEYVYKLSRHAKKLFPSPLSIAAPKTPISFAFFAEPH